MAAAAAASLALLAVAASVWDVGLGGRVERTPAAGSGDVTAPGIPTSAPAADPSPGVSASASTAPGVSPSATSARSWGAAGSTTGTRALSPFMGGRALRHVQRLARFGVRAGGSAVEARGAVYLAARLRDAGAAPVIRTFRLPDGRTSRNVVARVAGDTRDTIIVGAHMDSKHPSPGANDNASGCGVLLELARSLAAVPAHPTIEIVFFGSEEIIGSDPDAHHFGSRHHEETLSAAARDRTVGMISLDMVGYGSSLHVRTMGRGPQALRLLLLAEAEGRGLPLSYLRDPGATGWSDHEPFELAGIPASWIEWRDDPLYHTAGDTADRVVRSRLRVAGQFVLDVLRALDARDLDRLRQARTQR
jgi:hypothetical protein